jgi:exopolysaccharide production protein ExoZ
MTCCTLRVRTVAITSYSQGFPLRNHLYSSTMSMGRHTRVYGLQHLRFFAAFAVLVHHILEEASASPLAFVPPAAQRVGACGVDIFFVISGLVMWHTTRGFSSQTSARQFFARRLTRILPPYWACLALVIALSSSGIAFRHVQIGVVGLIESVFLLPPTTSARLVLGVAWTLVYELYFYLVCTVALCLPWQKYRVASILALIAGLPVVLGMLGARAQALYYGDPLVIEFLFGVFLGLTGARLPDARTGIRWVVLMTCAVLLWWAAAASPDAMTAGLSSSFRWWAWGLPATLLVVAFVHTKHDATAAGRALTVLGDASYVLYLTHGFWMIGFAKAVKSGVFHNALSLYLAALGVAAFAVVFSLGMHLYLEKPLLAWFEGRSSRTRQTAMT